MKSVNNINPKSKEYLAGFDCGQNGSNETNCHFSIFSSPENTANWEAGKKEGETMQHIKLTLVVMAEIIKSGKNHGTLECPKCKKTVHYRKAEFNKHIRMKCETQGCLQAME